MSGRSAQPKVAVIGGGFSGLMTTLSLLQHAGGPRVRLIERRAPFACGAAYSTTFKDHLLNVRAANMSAYPDQPDHFIRWLAETGVSAPAKAFVPRSRYGAYLQAMLAQATVGAAAGRLLLEADAVVGVRRRAGRWRLTYAMGRTVDVDAVVLAIGNFPPHPPMGLEDQAAASDAYAADPWSADFSRAPDKGLAVLIGSGLTMVDVALRLAADRPDLNLLAISRRGLLPHRHLDSGPALLDWDPGDAPSVRQVLRRMRTLAETSDWRSVVDGLRPRVHRIWRDWPDEERARFLRHARPWWDIHRHRLAPAVAARIDDLTTSGALQVIAGRIGRITSQGHRIGLDWRAKGEAATRNLTADLVVNCTGPTGQLARSKDALVADLARQKLIRADRQDLGLDVDGAGRLISVNGEASATLYSIGPVTRGAFWEVTAVPDIRLQAAALARHLCDQLREQLDRSDSQPAFKEA